MAREKYASRDEIAEILGCDKRTITNYIKLYPDFPSRVTGNNRTFPVARCVAWKIDRMVADAIASFSPPAPSNIVDAESRKAIAEAELAELKVKKLRGEVVPVATALKEVERNNARVAARILSVAGEFTPQIINLPSMAAAAAKLRELSSTILAELQQSGGLVDDDDPGDGDGAESGGEAAA